MNTVISDTLKNLKDQGIDIEKIATIEYKEIPYHKDSFYQTLIEFKIELINEPVTTTNERPKEYNPSCINCKLCRNFCTLHGDKISKKCPKGECTFSRSCPGNCI